MEVGEPGLGGRAGSSADSLAEEDEDEEGPGSGRSSRTSSLVSGLLTELYRAAEAAAPAGSARSRVLQDLQQRPSQVKYLRLKGTAHPACLALPAALGSAWAGSCPCRLAFLFSACKGVLLRSYSALSAASVPTFVPRRLFSQPLLVAVSPRSSCTLSWGLCQTRISVLLPPPSVSVQWQQKDGHLLPVVL